MDRLRLGGDVARGDIRPVGALGSFAIDEVSVLGALGNFAIGDESVLGAVGSLVGAAGAQKSRAGPGPR